MRRTSPTNPDDRAVWRRYQSNFPRHLQAVARHLQTEAMKNLAENCNHSDLRLSFEAFIALIGPSASCFPDSLFARGIHVVGGATVLDADTLAARLANGDPWGETVRRYAIDVADYPGLDTLLK